MYIVRGNNGSSRLEREYSQCIYMMYRKQLIQQWDTRRDGVCVCVRIMYIERAPYKFNQCDIYTTIGHNCLSSVYSILFMLYIM